MSTELELAFATLFLNRVNRSGIINAWPIGGLEQSGKWKIDARFTKDTIIDRLRKIQAHSDKIRVYNLDGIKFLKRLEEHKRKKRYFIFLDPPYYQKGKSLYLNHYDNKAHKELANFLAHSSLKWMMTYDDVPFIQELYKDHKKHEFDIQHSAYRSKTGKEVMIFADDIVAV